MRGMAVGRERKVVAVIEFGRRTLRSSMKRLVLNEAKEGAGYDVECIISTGRGDSSSGWCNKKQK